MADKIRDLMEQLARWRHFRHGGIGKTVLQRCMDGMPGTNCPTCAGAGRAPGAMIGHKARWIPCPTCGGRGRALLAVSHRKVRTRNCPNCTGRKDSTPGEIKGRTCIRCRGAAKVVDIQDKANPAFIHSTYREPDNPTLQRLDRLCCELRQRDTLLGYWFVINQEYFDHRGGTQEIKAGRLGIGYDNYRKRLQRALEWIDAARHDRRACREIPFPYES
jgi:hypothetical protein